MPLKLLDRPWFPFLLFSLLAPLCMFLSRFDLSPDQVSYLNIASLYAAGNWNEAINGFWSPLVSWLMAVPILAGASPWLASRMVCFASGLLILYSLRCLALVFSLSRPGIVLAIAAIHASTLAMRLSADLLSAGLLLLYFSEVWAPDWTSRRGVALRLGSLGALLYLAKNYLLFFFLLHFTLTVLLYFWRVPSLRPRLLRLTPLVILITLALSSLWISTLSAKYQRFTISRAGIVNIGMVGPESSGYRLHKLYSPPSSPSAFSTLQDPPPELLPAWSPLSTSGIRQILSLVKKNLGWLNGIYAHQSFFWLVIAVLFVLSARDFLFWVQPILAIALLPAGYLMVIIVDRYVWACAFLFLITGAAALDAMKSRWQISKPLLRCLAAAGAASFLWASLTEVRNLRGSGTLEWQSANQIRSLIAPKSHTMACGAYESSLLVNYWLGSRFYGLIRESAADRQYARELNPNYDRSQAALLPPVPPDAASKLDQFKPQWLFVAPSCEAISDLVSQRLDPAPPVLLPNQMKLYKFR